MRCAALCGFFDVDAFARPELFFARLELLFARVEPPDELFLARVEPLDDDFVLPEPFDEERPRLVARVAFPRSLATDIFNLRDLVRPHGRLGSGATPVQGIQKRLDECSTR